MRKKIFYNLDESDFTFASHEFVFYFSSKFYLNKFINKYIENRKDINYKLTSRFNINFISDCFCDFILYSQIEKRGFRVVQIDGGEVYTCQKEVVLNGRINKREICVKQ